MRSYAWLLLIFSLPGSQTFSTYAKPHASQDAKPTISREAPGREEYAVYGALLKEMFIGKKTKRLVVKKYTFVDDMSADGVPKSLDKFSALSQPTVDDFRSRNKLTSELTDQFNLDVKINFITGDEMSRIFRSPGRGSDGWEIFHQRYPTAAGIITFSRVGFNEDRSQALVFVAYGCGWLCGEGNYVFLTKKDGAWKIEGQSMTWVS